MNRKGLAPFIVFGIWIVLAILAIIFVGLLAKTIVGIILIAIGGWQIYKGEYKKKHKWIPYAFVIVGLIFILNPYEILDGLVIAR